ncbi:MAG: hypothetical protein ACO3EP_11995, partial [Phycisphaerales bacterium]
RDPSRSRASSSWDRSMRREIPADRRNAVDGIARHPIRRPRLDGTAVRHGRLRLQAHMIG